VKVEISAPTVMDTFSIPVLNAVPNLAVDLTITGIIATGTGTTITIPVDPEGLTNPAPNGTLAGFVPFYEYRDVDNNGGWPSLVDTVIYDDITKTVTITLKAVSTGQNQNLKLYFHLDDTYVVDGHQGTIPLHETPLVF